MRRQRIEDTRDTSAVPPHEQAREVLVGLRKGEIFFIVQEPDEMEELVRARKLIVEDGARRRPAVALAVRSDVTREQLNEHGEESLKTLFGFHRAVDRTLNDRLFVKDQAVINVKGIGSFPESVTE